MTEAKELSPEAKAALGTMPAAASESVVSARAHRNSPVGVYAALRELEAEIDGLQHQNGRLALEYGRVLDALQGLYDACELRANKDGGEFGEIIGPAAEIAEVALSRKFSAG